MPRPFSIRAHDESPLRVSETSRSPLRRRRRIGLSCLGLLLAIGLGLWAAQDAPRRAVAAVLSDRRAARVHLDRLEILGPDRFRLAGLTVTDLRDYPFVESLRLEEVVVEGPLRGIAGNRFDRLVLRGVHARLAPAAHVAPPDRPLPMIGELILEPASIRVAAAGRDAVGGDAVGGDAVGGDAVGGDDLQLCGEAVVWDVGAGAGGQARLSAASLDLAPIHALLDPATRSPASGEPRGFVAELRFDAAGSHLDLRAAGATPARGGAGVALTDLRWRLDASGPWTGHRLAGERATFTVDDRRIEVDRPSTEGTLALDDGGRLHLDLAARLGGLATGRLRADYDPAAERLRGLEARLHGLDVQTLWPDSRLEGTAGAVLTGTGDQLEVAVEIHPTRFALAPDLELWPAAGSIVRIAGTSSFEPLANLRTPVWDGPVTGSIHLPGGQGRWAALRWPAALFPLTGSFEGRGEARRFTGSARLDGGAGRLLADGEVAFLGGGADADLTWKWAGLDLERITSLLRAAGAPAPAASLSGVGEAAGTVRGLIGTGAGPDVEGRLDLRRLAAQPAGEGEAPAWSLSGGEAAIVWSWDGGQEKLDLPEIEASGTVAVPGLEPLALTLQAAADARDVWSRGRFEGTLRESADSDGLLGSADFHGDWRRLAGGTEIDGRAHLDGLDLARWQRTATFLSDQPALADYRLQGTAGTELEGSFTGDFGGGDWRLAGPARLEAAGFTSTDGSRVLEGLDSPWQVDVSGGRDGAIEAEGTGRLGGFLLLWQTFFGDFSGARASLTAGARIEPAGDDSRPRRWRLEAGATLPQGPAAEGTLERGSGAGLRYSLSLDDRDLATTHERYLAEMLEEQFGRFTAGGALEARVRGSVEPAAGAPNRWSVIGDVRLRGLHLESGGGQAAVAGLDLDLPLDLRRRPEPELDFSGPRLSGRLAFERLAVRGLELPATESDLVVEADAVGLEEAIRLDVLGGALTLERLTLNQLLRPDRHLESGIELAGLSLERISEELELIPLDGALNGHLTGVRLSPSTLRVDGGGVIEAFGGTVEVRDISGQDVLSRFPKLQLSADLSGLDLGALTRRLDFGEMTGTLQGTVEDLELFRGVPVRFSARLETTRREGVPRTVDVKAINNITILGTGQRTNIFDRGLRSFFKHYTYERLGVTLHLDNDVLLLRGLEQRDGKELFLRGRPPLRIDVVNAQPGKTVSFQTMVGRLKSLDFARATTER